MLSNTTKLKQTGNDDVSKKIIPLSPVLRGFVYHSDLDAKFLYTFHGNDWEQALFSFELFLEITVKEVFKLVNLLRSEDMNSVLSLIHKIRPGFLMVGLSDFDVFFNNIKLKEFQTIDKTYLSHIITFWWENFQEKIKIIRQERVRLEFFIKTKNFHQATISI